MAGLAIVITLDVHDGGFGASFAETIQEHSVGVLLQAVGWAHVMLMATLGVCVRTFHRRTLRSVLAGPYIRWRRWGLGWLVAVVAVAGLWGMARAAGSAGSFPVDGSVVVIVLVSSLYAVSVEGFRGYLLQAISARCGAWRIGGHPSHRGWRPARHCFRRRCHTSPSLWTRLFRRPAPPSFYFLPSAAGCSGAPYRDG
jgi:hypothetical protein